MAKKNKERGIINKILLYMVKSDKSLFIVIPILFIYALAITILVGLIMWVIAVIIGKFFGELVTDIIIEILMITLIIFILDYHYNMCDL